MVKHWYIKIRGFDKDGRVTSGADFQNTYHLNPEHIFRKHPSLNNNIYINNRLLSSLRGAHLLMLNESSLILNRCEGVLIDKDITFCTKYFINLLVPSVRFFPFAPLVSKTP